MKGLYSYMAFAAIALFVISPDAKSAIVSNGNFSSITGTLAANDVCTPSPTPAASAEGITACTADNWTGAYQIANGPGNVINNSFNIRTPIPGGGNTLVLQQVESASQTISVPTSGEYDLSFFIANRSNAPYNGAQLLDVSIDGSTLVGGSFSSIPTTWTSENFLFNLTAGTHSLTFAGLDPSGTDVTAFVSDVQLGPPVPLPAAVWLMLSGLGGLTAFIGKRRPALPQNESMA